MINVVNTKVNYDDRRMITSVEVKVKSIDDLVSNPLLGTVSAALHETTLLADEGKSLSMKVDSKRKNVIDILLRFQSNTLTQENIAHFITALQRAIDKTDLLFKDNPRDNPQ